MRLKFRLSTPARAAGAILLAVVILLSSAMPAYAQSNAEEEDDANKTAKTPEECVRPDAPDQDDLSDVSRVLEANQLYEDCLERTEGNASEGEENGPDATETAEPDPAAVNRNATEPEECVEPAAPDENTDYDEYEKKQQAYDDCLLRTGPDGGGGDEGNGGSGGNGQGGDQEGSGSGNGGAECAKPDEDAPAHEMRDYEACLDSSGQMENDDPVSGDSEGGDGGNDGDGGLNSMVLGFFTGIMNEIWDWTFGWALEKMADAFASNLFSLPSLEDRGDLLGYYKDAVGKLRPAILVGILVLGILMMVRSDNYDLAYAGFQGLPKLMGIALALAFLPQFMGELSRITTGMTEVFFPGQGDVSAAGKELFKAAVGNLALTNFLNLLLLIAAGWVGMLLVIVALLNKILYAVLFVAGAFALTASIVPSLSSLAGSWFRGVMASAAIPALWSIEMSIGTLVVTSPESIFGSGATNFLNFVSESAVTSLGAIITMWIMYKTPFKCIEWAFNVQLPGRGGLMGLAKAGAALAIAIPAKTAVAHATKSLLNRSSNTGGSMPKNPGAGKDGTDKKGISGKQDASSKTRRIQQIGNQGKQDRTTNNLIKAADKYNRQQGHSQEGKEKFMQKGSRGSGGGGMGNQSGSRSRNKG